MHLRSISIYWEEYTHTFHILNELFKKIVFFLRSARGREKKEAKFIDSHCQKVQMQLESYIFANEDARCTQILTLCHLAFSLFCFANLLMKRRAFCLLNIKFINCRVPIGASMQIYSATVECFFVKWCLFAGDEVCSIPSGYITLEAPINRTLCPPIDSEFFPAKLLGIEYWPCNSRNLQPYLNVQLFDIQVIKISNIKLAVRGSKVIVLHGILFDITIFQKNYHYHFSNCIHRQFFFPNG